MRFKKWFLKLIGGILFIAVAASCSSPTPTLAPTVDIQPTLNAVKTESALTVIADLTLNAPTATPILSPTLTATPIPSNTPLPTATATNTYLPVWTETPVSPAYSCIVTDSLPKVRNNFSPRADFDGGWIIKNTGKEKWLQNEVDISYSSGTKLQKAVDSVNLPTDVASGKSYTVKLDMTAPADAGTYTTTWVVNSGEQVLCSMSLTIIVK